MGGALYCASFGGAISKISTMLLHRHGSVSHCLFRGTCCAVLVRGANVLGCSGDDPLESLNLSLGLHRIALTCHLLFAKAAVVDTVRVIEEEARFLVLATHLGMLAGKGKRSRAGTRENGRSHLHHGVPTALAEAGCTVTHDGRDKGEANRGWAVGSSRCAWVCPCGWVPFTGNGFKLA